jgi:hypothetical protein
MLQDTVHEIREKRLIMLRRGIFRTKAEPVLDELLNNVIGRVTGDLELIKRLKGRQSGGTALHVIK